MLTKFNPLLLSVLALALMMTGLWLTAREIAPFDYAYRAGQDPTQLAADGVPAHAMSSEGNRVLLEICAMRLQGLSFFTSPSAVKTAIAGNCAEMAAAATEMMPTYSYGHYVSALALLRLEETGDAQDALFASQRMARNEQWVAELRVALAEDNTAAFPDYVASAHLEDLALLAQSNRGVRSIARRYVASPLFRDRITAVVDTLPDEVQARFLQRVRAEARTLIQAR